LLLGAHRATVGGLHTAFAGGDAIGAKVIQVFTSSPRQWRARELDAGAIEAWEAARAAAKVRLVVAHDSYLINLAATDPAIRARSIAAFTDELERCRRLAIPYLVTHPGAHVGAGEAAGLASFAAALRGIYDAHPEFDTMTLLETTAGQGTSLGARFEEIAELLAAIGHETRLGVCLDTSHVFAAGYDLRTPESEAAVVSAFDDCIDLARLKVIHLNDSKGKLGSRVDRHERIGRGEIGDEAFRALLADPRLRPLPMLVETPGLEHHGAELRRLRRLARLETKHVASDAAV
jgi:deoxyribonuclease-4